MLETLFWFSVLLVGYIYVFYPAILYVMAKKPLVIRCEPDYQPTVSILIAAFNEERDIVATLENKIAQNYPQDKFEVLVVSDESTDATDDLVNDFAERSPVPVRLLRQEPRAGKTAGLNKLVPEASGDIIVFSDANSLWGEDTLTNLCRNFSDSKVGYVTGKMIYVAEDGSTIGDGCSSYMKYENWLRESETAIGSIVGVDGGIDAMRRSIHAKLNDDQLPDFVQPLKVVEKGYRVIYEPEAILKEHSLTDSSAEYRMRVRVSLRAIWALWDMKQLFNPFSYGIFSWQLLSHKLLRYLAFLPLLTALFSNFLIMPDSWFYTLTFLIQVLFYCAAYLDFKGWLAGPDLLRMPHYFCLLNIASAEAFWRFLKGEKKVLWKPREG